MLRLPEIGEPSTEVFCTKFWSPDHNIPDDELDEYINITKTEHGYNEEQALALLHINNYDIKKAMSEIKDFMPITENWSDEEKRLFVKGLRIYGKRFHLIQKMRKLSNTITPGNHLQPNLREGEEQSQEVTPLKLKEPRNRRTRISTTQTAQPNYIPATNAAYPEKIPALPAAHPKKIPAPPAVHPKKIPAPPAAHPKKIPAPPAAHSDKEEPARRPPAKPPHTRQPSVLAPPPT
ncbi:uncharacterized protein [Engystomops pustulosus]|uniref:uncharacterized protein n=1 Tax=Engystomops pustulosus TaxID=76066 RepID=UPI003AFB6889